MRAEKRERDSLQADISKTYMVASSKSRSACYANNSVQNPSNIPRLACVISNRETEHLKSSVEAWQREKYVGYEHADPRRGRQSNIKQRFYQYLHIDVQHHTNHYSTCRPAKICSVPHQDLQFTPNPPFDQLRLLALITLLDTQLHIQIRLIMILPLRN